MAQAVHFLNEKNGVSLSSIRKWILAKYPETKDKQKASFNSLTIKASGGIHFSYVCTTGTSTTGDSYG